MRRTPAPPNRFAPFLALALALGALTVAASAAAHPERAASVRFTFIPARALQGEQAAVSVAVKPRGTRCSLVVRYANGARQPGLGPVTAGPRGARWSWRVPATAETGTARVTASCGRAGRMTRTMQVVASEDTKRYAVVVQKGGVSQRTNRFGGGSTVSYGMVLANTSPTHDALDLNVVVNFVDATNRVLGSATQRVQAVKAGGTFALGGSSSLRTTTPVSRIEVTGLVEGRALAAVRQPPTTNVRVVPGRTDAGFVAAVEGEVINDHPTHFLTRARVYVVLFDAAGNVIGGGSGFVSASLPSGERVFFNANQGVDAVPYDRVAATMVSVEATYTAP